MKAVSGMMVTLILFSGLVVSLVYGNPVPYPPNRDIPSHGLAVVLAEFCAFFVGIVVLDVFGLEKKKVALVSAIVVLTSFAAGIAIWMLTGFFPPPPTTIPTIAAVSFLAGEFCGFLVGWFVLMLFGMERKNAVFASTIILLTSLLTSVFFYWWAGVL